ncbi:MAG: helix-turn-helix domain-containing protein [Chloroflexota bacterium]|nr:helix-turn-helix domain-containing protein [Chloroflexota bacterium]
MDITSLPPTLTIEECALVLRLSRGSAYEAARTGQIPTIRIGRRLLVPRAKLMQMLGEEAHEPV